MHICSDIDQRDLLHSNPTSSMIHSRSRHRLMHQRNPIWIVFCTSAQVNCLVRVAGWWWSIEHWHCCRSWYVVCFSGAEEERERRGDARGADPFLSSRSVLMMSLLSKCACSLPHSWQDPPIKQSLKLLLLFSYSHISSKCLKLNYLNDEYVASYSVGWFQWNCSLSLNEREKGRLNCAH